MRSRNRNFSIYSLSAVDLFASAMGAFIIIAIILMPDYQKEIRLEGHLDSLMEMAARSESILDESELGMDRLMVALSSAQTRQLELQAEEDIISSELETLQALLQSRKKQPPPPPPALVESELETGSRQVTFRFLGLKTEKTRFLLMVDMNKYLAEHQDLVMRSVDRALDSLQPGYEFAILGFQQLDSGPSFRRWPEDGSLAVRTAGTRAEAMRFMSSLKTDFMGGSPLLAAFEEAFRSPADAAILFSDGLPNPSYNAGMPSRALAQSITIANSGAMEIHSVVIGDYFKYQGTVEFMETLARANSGGFLALAQ